MDPELGLLDRLGRLAGDEDLGGVPALGIGGAVAIAPREGRGEVDGRVGDGLDKLDVLPVTPTQELVHRGVERRGVDNPPELHQRLTP